MNIIETLHTMYEQFTKTEKKIADYMLNNIDIISRDGATEISKRTGFSPASLTRFVKKLGFENYSQFVYRVQRDMNKDIKEELGTAAMYYEVFKELDRRFGKKELRQVCEVLENVNSIYVTGYHISKPIALNFANMLSMMRYQIRPLAYDDAFKMDAYVRHEDLVVIISAHSDIYKDYLRNLHNLGDSRPKIMLITMSPKHSLAHMADEVVVLPTSSSIGSLHYTDQTILYQYFFLRIMNELEAKE